VNKWILRDEKQLGTSSAIVSEIEHMMQRLEETGCK